MSRLLGLAPLVNAHTRLLVLGSFPGVASLTAQQYYGHPQNQFWKILGQHWSLPLPAQPYAERVETMLARGIGLWDVYGACERKGSLDVHIRQGELNDFKSLQLACPGLCAIAHNGAESFKHAQYTAHLGVPVFKLPSTSPAHASWSFVRKLEAWTKVLDAAGV